MIQLGERAGSSPARCPVVRLLARDLNFSPAGQKADRRRKHRSIVGSLVSRERYGDRHRLVVATDRDAFDRDCGAAYAPRDLAAVRVRSRRTKRRVVDAVRTRVVASSSRGGGGSIQLDPQPDSPASPRAEQVRRDARRDRHLMYSVVAIGRRLAGAENAGDKSSRDHHYYQ